MEVRGLTVSSLTNRRRKSLLLFVFLAFGIPWIGWIAALTVAKATPYQKILFYLGDGCSLAGLIATWYATGRKGLFDLLKRTINPVAPLSWWMYTIFLPVLWLVASYLLYGLFWKHHIGSLDLRAFYNYGTVPVLFFWLTGSLGEEFGWRGFFLPHLLRVYSPLKAALIVGIVWATWHTPLYYTLWIASPVRAINFLVGVTSFSILLTALYVGTKGNLMLCMFLHWMINASQSVISGVFPDLRFTTSLGTIQLVVQVIITAGVIWYLKLSKRVMPEENKTFRNLATFDH